MSSANTSPDLRAKYNGCFTAITTKPLIFQRFADGNGAARCWQSRRRNIL
jgi:hypothetical protein